MSEIDLRGQLEQPLTLAYLSCVTMSMLDMNTRNSENPEEYVTGILDTAKVMVDLVLKEQLEAYTVQLESIKADQDISDEELEETLKEVGVPTYDGFKSIVEEIIEGHAGKFTAYKDAIIVDINKDK